MCIPHEKIVYPYFSSHVRATPLFLNHVSFDTVTKFENLGCKIHVSQKVFELKPSCLGILVGAEV